MDIETKNATLATMAVTINALHVKGKQMTLAVFRQLPKGIEQPSSELWGIVRYAINDDGDLWLVFSQDGRLFRRALDLSPPRPVTYIIRDLERSLVKAQYAVEMSYTEEMLTNARAKANAIATNLEEEKEIEQDRMMRETHRYNNDKQLAEMRQLFIAV